MSSYPLNLVLAVAVASATIFLGFLPTKDMSSTLFARETLRAAFAWIIVALASPLQIIHYPLIFAILCLVAWGKFRDDHAFNGKMWLTLASGLGISIGVMVILAVTPGAYPPGMPQPAQTLHLLSIYLGGTVIGLAYACLVLARSIHTHAGIAHVVFQRYVRLLPVLTVARAGVLLGTCYFANLGIQPRAPLDHDPYDYFDPDYVPHLELLLLGLVVILLPALAIFTQRASHFSSRILPTRILLTICLLGFFAETLARLLVL